MDLFLAFSLAFFLCVFCAMCVGRAVLPVHGLWIMVVARGNAEDLEQKLFALMWLHGLGFLRCPIFLLNDQLTEEGLELVAHLIKRWPHVTLCDVAI